MIEINHNLAELLRLNTFWFYAEQKFESSENNSIKLVIGYKCCCLHILITANAVVLLALRQGGRNLTSGVKILIFHVYNKYCSFPILLSHRKKCCSLSK